MPKTNQVRIFSTLFFVFFGIATSFAQSCLSGGLTLTSQQQVNDFPSDYPGCSVITGGLTISENIPGNITNLTPLAQITRVEGRLLIFDNTGLSTLTGLDNLVEVASSVRISKCDNLVNLTGLGGMTDIGSFLSVDNNDNITDFSGLNAQLMIGGRLEIDGNPALQNLDGLSGVSRVGNTTLSITDNPLLTSITGLGSVDISSIANLVIEQNTSLAVCEEPFVCTYLMDPSNLASITGNGVGCNSRQEVEDACSALPVEYRQFTGTNTNKYVDLSWTIVNQENNEGFEVLASRNGETWEVIGFVRATSAVSYQFRDESPVPGANFYRLRQIDLDGANSLSAILTFNISEVASLVVYPNPVSDVLYLSGSIMSQETEVRLFDALGRQVVKGRGSTELRIENIHSGTYLLICTSGDQTAVYKVQIAH